MRSIASAQGTWTLSSQWLQRVTELFIRSALTRQDPPPVQPTSAALLPFVSPIMAETECSVTVTSALIC